MIVVLPAPVWPTKAIDLARLHVQVDVLEDRHALDVVEVDVVEVDAAFDVFELDGVRLVEDAGGRIEHFEDALAAGHRALEHRVLHDEVADRVEEAASRRS